MHHIYCISGLGADFRIFQNLSVLNAELHCIQWVQPAIDEDMSSYALQLAAQIKHPEIILIGVSFGGMLASEISRQYQAQHAGDEKLFQFKLLQTVIISSCKLPSEFPLLMKLAGALRLHRAVPYKLMLRQHSFNRLLFDLRSSEEELYVKRLMLDSNNTELIKRSINIILTWKQQTPAKLLHIHGTADRLLLPGKIKADYWIKNGGHFMVWNRANEVSSIINAIISGL